MNPSSVWGFDAVRAAMSGDGTRAPLVALVLGLVFLVPGIAWRAPAMMVLGALLVVLWVIWTTGRMRSGRRARRLSARSANEDGGDGSSRDEGATGTRT